MLESDAVDFSVRISGPKWLMWYKECLSFHDGDTARSQKQGKLKKQMPPISLHINRSSQLKITPARAAPSDSGTRYSVNFIQLHWV